MTFKVTGPKGGTLIRRANPVRLVKVLPGLVKRFGKVAVGAPDPAPAPKKPPAKPAPKPPTATATRAAVVRWARWGPQHEPEIHYTETASRADWLTTKPGTLPLSTDCSGFATACFKWAGAPDPNGLGYHSLGYTGTLLQHGKAIPAGEVRPGDLVVYGPGTGHHVGVIVTAGKDPLTVSHGQEKGPLLIRVSEERKYQPAGVRYLSFLP